MSLRALVIGNSRYEKIPLANTVNDAKDVTDLLKSLGFNVTELIDLPRDRLLQSIRKHYASMSSTRGISSGLRRINSNNVVHMVYYSGHSIEIQGVQYIVPIDSDISQMNNFRAQLISIKEIMPDRYGVTVENNYTLYSTEPGGLAMDGDRTNSPFTKALLKGLSNPSLDLFSVFTHIRQTVKASTNGRQIPWIAASADQPLWLGDKSKRNIKGGASIVILDGCRDDPFKAILR